MLLPSDRPNEVQQRFIDLKYGMFVHFGINTFINKGWSNGKVSPLLYLPTEIDTDGWAQNAHRAGFNYILFTAKHHDGFCMWDTKYSDYGVKSSPNKTDVVKALAESCKKFGIKLGFYYSLWDRHEPTYKDHEKYVGYMLNQMEELMDGRYGEIAELWLDGSWVKKSALWGLERIYKKVRELQPYCAIGVNHTIGRPGSKGLSRFPYTPAHCKRGYPMRHFPSDFRARDPLFPLPGDRDNKIYSHDGKEYYLPYEADISVRNFNNWFWNTGYPKDKLVPIDFIVEKYRQLTEQGNVFVVNVAPNIHGKQEEGDIEHLIKAAKVLGINR
ncbi:MAG: alpha-L-fucosidase [Clostridiales bacterium]|jgi:alpha-L-fucosidase|nr:alpha-L-fucosidase [Clostridiales bacterium]HOB64034.1 alpha-L-fucosidase [Clostridia bacterium]HOK82460.1 alpha-L-fucosidase [Clostridia bacterium]HOL61591.1 alpha-L-fucosidase [Clostridia bacterium]HPO54209.1 alpha-L-fucosidase [Clostridia bacterium]